MLGLHCVHARIGVDSIFKFASDSGFGICWAPLLTAPNSEKLLDYKVIQYNAIGDSM